jgi:alcohol dehydrogenase, propanol-preferring
MKAMVLHAPSPVDSAPLHLEEVAEPEPGPGEVRVRVEKCGVCRTDLHVVEGDLPPLRPHVIPGHEIVGQVDKVGEGVLTLEVGDRVGVPWLHQTCGRCEYCLTGRENLCDNKQYTGYSVDGGYAGSVVGREGYVFHLPNGDSARQAPLLCAGIIGYRALKLALPRPGGRIGFFGFGGSAHLALQLASKLGFETVAYSRSRAHLDLARRLGATETVLSSADPPASTHAPSLDGAVDFAPAGETVPPALRELKKGGTLSIAAIHMSPIPSLDYDHLVFGERKILGVESNTREDATEFLTLAARFGILAIVQERKLDRANEALQELKAGKVDGALVLDCS